MFPKPFLIGLSFIALAACGGEAYLDREVPNRIDAFNAKSPDREDRVVNVINATGGNIFGFLARGTGETNWGTDIFGLDWLQDGQSVEITVDNGSDICVYDFLV